MIALAIFGFFFVLLSFAMLPAFFFDLQRNRAERMAQKSKDPLLETA